MTRTDTCFNDFLKINKSKIDSIAVRSPLILKGDEWREEDFWDDDVVRMVKPIQATPELSGKDAVRLLRQVSAKPAERAIKHNDMLRSVLADIRKR